MRIEGVRFVLGGSSDVDFVSHTGVLRGGMVVWESGLGGKISRTLFLFLSLIRWWVSNYVD